MTRNVSNYHLRDFYIIIPFIQLKNTTNIMRKRSCKTIYINLIFYLTECPKKIIPFSNIFLWDPDVILELESFIYQKLGNKSKFFLPYKDSIWAPFVTRQISRR